MKKSSENFWRAKKGVPKFFACGGLFFVVEALKTVKKPLKPLKTVNFSKFFPKTVKLLSFFKCVCFLNLKCSVSESPKINYINATTNSYLWVISKQSWLPGPQLPEPKPSFINACALAINSSAVLFIGLSYNLDFYFKKGHP